jgi:hypothetical protein
LVTVSPHSANVQSVSQAADSPASSQSSPSSTAPSPQTPAAEVVELVVSPLESAAEELESALESAVDPVSATEPVESAGVSDVESLPEVSSGVDEVDPGSVVVAVPEAFESSGLKHPRATRRDDAGRGGSRGCAGVLVYPLGWTHRRDTVPK